MMCRRCFRERAEQIGFRKVSCSYTFPTDTCIFMFLFSHLVSINARYPSLGKVESKSILVVVPFTHALLNE